MTDPAYVSGPVRVRVPATSANLGPGFDSFGLALSLWDEIEAAVAPSGVAVRVSGEGADDVPLNQDHLVVRAMHAAFDRLGGAPPGLAVRCVNRIPHARGLGSSSAAIVGGILAARALTVDGDTDLDTVEVLRLASGLEGHPDNVAACLHGGFTIAWTSETGAHAVRLEPSPRLRPVVFVPERRALTEQARGLLPDHVPHPDAAANAGRAGLLVHALTSDPRLLMDATEDRLHQSYRAAAMEHSAALIGHLRSAGVPAVISGSGPSVLALASGEMDLAGFQSGGFQRRPLAVAHQGASAG
ncbi:MAG: homoserine kinase [Micromonosporaceae bacterium]